MAVKFSDFTSTPLNSTGFVVGWDSATNQNIQISHYKLTFRRYYFNQLIYL